MIRRCNLRSRAVSAMQKMLIAYTTIEKMVNYTCMSVRYSTTLVSNYFDRDYLFDTQQRALLRNDINMRHYPRSGTKMKNGSLGVRCERARCNQTKLLPSATMGIT